MCWSLAAASSQLTVAEAQEKLKMANGFNIAGIVIGIVLNVIVIIYTVNAMEKVSEMQEQQRSYGDY